MAPGPNGRGVDGFTSTCRRSLPSFFRQEKKRFVFGVVFVNQLYFGACFSHNEYRDNAASQTKGGKKKQIKRKA